MIPGDSTLLRSWRRLWEIRQFWVAFCHDGWNLSDAEAAQLVARRFAQPITAQEAFDELLDEGEFHSAARLLQEPSFLDALERPSAALHDELVRRQTATVRQVLARGAFLRSRARRLVVDDRACHRDELRRVCETRTADAVSHLDTLERELERRQEEHTARLRVEAEERLAARGLPSEERARWLVLVDEMLACGELDWIRDQLPTLGLREVSRVLTPWPHELPRPPHWPYDDSAREVCKWFLDASGVDPSHRPVGFIDRWGTEDLGSLDLILELAFVLDGPEPAQIRQFVTSLERFLGVPQPATPSVEAVGDLLITHLRGLPDGPMPALAAARHPKGVPLYFAREWTLPRTASLPFGILFCRGPSQPCPGAWMRLDARDLFPLMTHAANRPWDLLRGLCARLDLDAMFPDAGADPEAPWIVGRDAEITALLHSTGSRLVSGPPGIGKTALLCRVAEARARAGWTVLWLVDPEHPATSGRVPGTCVADIATLRHALAAPLASHGPRANVLVLVDVSNVGPEGIDELFSSRDVIQRRVQVIAATRPAVAARVHARPAWTCVGTADGAETLQLGPLGVELRRLLLALFDVMGIRNSPAAAVDRLLWCADGNPRLFWRLLQCITANRASRKGRRRTPITCDEVEVAWSSSVMQERLHELILIPLENVPAALFVLFALIGEDMSGGISLEHLHEHFELYDRPGLSAEMTLALAVLESSRLILRTDDTDPRVRLAESSVGAFLVTLDPDEYLSRL